MQTCIFLHLVIGVEWTAADLKAEEDNIEEDTDDVIETEAEELADQGIVITLHYSCL